MTNKDKNTYRGKPKIKLMGKEFYIDDKGRGHPIKRRKRNKK